MFLNNCIQSGELYHSSLASAAAKTQILALRFSAQSEHHMEHRRPGGIPFKSILGNLPRLIVP